jgi:hypothetical protein
MPNAFNGNLFISIPFHEFYRTVYERSTKCIAAAFIKTSGNLDAQVREIRSCIPFQATRPGESSMFFTKSRCRIATEKRSIALAG